VVVYILGWGWLQHTPVPLPTHLLPHPDSSCLPSPTYLTWPHCLCLPSSRCFCARPRVPRLARHTACRVLCVALPHTIPARTMPRTLQSLGLARRAVCLAAPRCACSPLIRARIWSPRACASPTFNACIAQTSYSCSTLPLPSMLFVPPLLTHPAHAFTRTTTCCAHSLYFHGTANQHCLLYLTTDLLHYYY